MYQLHKKYTRQREDICEKAEMEKLQEIAKHEELYYHSLHTNVSAMLEQYKNFTKEILDKALVKSDNKIEIIK